MTYVGIERQLSWMQEMRRDVCYRSGAVGNNKARPSAFESTMADLIETQ
jgi:hypothetical protein